ncbi:hypothetical protein [Ferruginibacter sp.]|uniref:hypothetical protein n=1 Tax=Ferruginibacter sp. TaxID=1940288 RepID=UPI0019C7B41B|nr:hypothetical protein [Ferruginibacter sp.]MBC7626817.1 hypothetical protein [Ferruginibacter sp.]
MKPLFIILIAAALFSCKTNSNSNDLYGTWKVKFADGTKGEVRFSKNGTHNYFMDGKLFSSGKSTFKNDTLREFDPICNDIGNYYSTYKVDFLAGDSMRFTAIEDSCKPRRLGLDGGMFYLIKRPVK